MYYRKVETYKFMVPREFKAYLAFKQKLKDLGVHFIDEGGSMQQEITVTESGQFEIDDDGVIIKEKK